jgi:nucleotide-binding universal stress UspA family protein
MAGSVFRHLLIPTDGSENSLAAGELAFRLAEDQHARITLLHVVDTEVLRETVRVSDEEQPEAKARMQREGEKYLDHLERMGRTYQVDMVRELRDGDPHDEIVDCANERGVDLIVMGHAGRRGPRRKITGSVAERVIRFADCPVLVLAS